MYELIAHAASLGVSVHMAHLPAPYRGFYDADRHLIVYDFNLTPVERRSVLAHELGHAFYGHDCSGVESFEDAADLYAACLLIDVDAYRDAELIDSSSDAIADELGVEVRLVRVFERRALTRMRGVTYVGSRMGRGQHGFYAENRE